MGFQKFGNIRWKVMHVRSTRVRVAVPQPVGKPKYKLQRMVTARLEAEVETASFAYQAWVLTTVSETVSNFFGWVHSGQEGSGEIRWLFPDEWNVGDYSADVKGPKTTLTLELERTYSDDVPDEPEYTAEDDATPAGAQ